MVRNIAKLFLATRKKLRQRSVIKCSEVKISNKNASEEKLGAVQQRCATRASFAGHCRQHQAAIDVTRSNKIILQILRA